MAPATPIGSRTRGAKSPCSSSSFINASAVPSPTVCSIIRQTPRGHRRRHSKPPIEKPTYRFSRCWTFSLRKCLNSETKILRLVHQEPSSRASRGMTCEFPPFFAGGAGLLGACSHFSDTLLGADRASVLQMVLSQGLRLTLFGV